MENQSGNSVPQMGDQPTSEVEQFIQSRVVPALEQIRTELTRYNRQATFVRDENSVALNIEYNGQHESEYRVRVNDRIASPTLTTISDNGEAQSAGGYFQHGLTNYTIDDLPTEEIVSYFMNEYKYKLGLN